MSVRLGYTSRMEKIYDDEELDSRMETVDAAQTEAGMTLVDVVRAMIVDLSRCLVSC